ncbi:MAG: type I DNA topoisomerase [Acidaminococcales bacterium]|jgi:DNA topoisomerase-1|nr:type I DNA topoisomerase [Acidaminococcales bacterium]
MGKTLVIVESPTKAKTIGKFLGKNYSVIASMGHLRDLPKSQFGVDTERQYQAKYINIRNKGELIKELKNKAKSAGNVLLATDPDREGEAIAWHLAFILDLPENSSCRVVFNEVTGGAIKEAIKKPRPIDQAMVDAQQARRILDRIVGYKLSPLLWRKIRKGLSAGRVQSVAVKLICDREKEIQAFKPEEYWTLAAKLREEPRGALFTAELVKSGGKKLKITNERQARALEERLKKEKYKVAQVAFKERRRNPAPPYTTSGLQQDAVRRLGFTTKKTMMLAQQLYEGISLGESGAAGLITYMRTDSVRIADYAQKEAKAYLENRYGKAYCPARPPVYSVKSGAQDAHEAIRPSDILKTPESVKAYLSRDQLRLYAMIWQRFAASQMAPAVFDTTSAGIAAGSLELKATGSVLKFDGFLAVYDKKDGEAGEKEVILPRLKAGQELLLDKVPPAAQHFTEPPPRYTEAALVKKLEENGIGRPSTYSPIINTILERRYVEKEDKKFFPTELGITVVQLLSEYFADIVDVEFSAHMEKGLDDIAEGHADKIKLLDGFYRPFANDLAAAEDQIGAVEIEPEVTDTKCEKCGRFMVIKHGRFGDFLACPGFPACRNAKPILKKIGIKCPLCGNELLELKSKRGRKFYGCEKYPECTFVTWDKPTEKRCAKCSGILVEKTNRSGQTKLVCINNECADGTNKNALRKKK